jgi:transcriptional regulator with XRE-family HTH domain
VTGGTEQYGVARRLRRLRQATGLNMAEFSELCGVGYTAYSGWETAKTLPPLHRLMSVRRHLSMKLGRRVEWEELLGP